MTAAVATRQCARPRCTRAPYRGGMCWPHYQRTWPAPEDAGPYRRRLRELTDAGWTIKALSVYTGVCEASLTTVLSGRWPRVYGATAARLRRLLDGPIDAAALAPTTCVPVLGTRRRLQALRAAGWDPADLAEATGITRGAVYSLSTEEDRATVHARPHLAVARFFLDHQADPVRPVPPRIARRGWPLPMQWDPARIDDPAARSEGGRR
ncbi:hypothetical protein CSPHI_04945 [Corynebacterium sphenisci DSM 44792]|uniref:Uncharacterized protein n=1 Tax=Corynebacterium sphenisci DSM 44792 TaxID=1437874 RepID=A0A1L7CXH7_9CORY|nr:hypothetical protein [Corynebacterium sphenisci]APT90492.1 hypothetical protein CSPHI_04945 [Corynebacterium sphenisci DSM 44792]